MADYENIYQRLKEDGWYKYDDVKQYSNLGERYRVFFSRKKVKGLIANKNLQGLF
ncbi:MAG: hypothetical protein MUO64_14040 [Anaerolineales bacterium]|nr:hypothetical protein [Anaerolineales bacterium]